MQWIVQTLKEHPEIAIFLTLAVGYFIGSFKFGKFSLGAVVEIRFGEMSSNESLLR